MDEQGERVANASLQQSILPHYSPAQMSSPAPTVVDVPVMPVDAGPDHATSLRLVGSITYDREENGYNLEWETRADFDRWLTHEQKANGIEMRLAKSQISKARRRVYLTCKTFRCTRNGTGGLSRYEKKTARERKIESKRIEGGCPCFVQIKTYPHTDIVLGKYISNHSHAIGMENLKFIRMRDSTREMIAMVRHGKNDKNIVSDPPSSSDNN